ncbi:hypothetical protein DXG01_000218 [Tephrocybe rancida]|nr:hypothetical protein DXG01_000218 [Tephrocybe rancida]
MPRSRKAPSNTEQNYIVVHDSESESDTETTGPALRHNPKRQRAQGNNTNILKSNGMSIDPNATRDLSSLNTNQNAHLKGRRRFKADLSDIVQDCSSGNTNLARVSGLQAGEDEGTIEVTIRRPDGQHVLGFTLLISEPSDYPKNHTFFCSSSDLNIPSHISDVLDNVASDSPRTIQDTIQKILGSLAKGRNRVNPINGLDSQEVDIDDDDNSTGDYEALDQFEAFGNGSTADVKKLDLQKLQNDFVETVATNYRPGVLHFADDDFAISVSLPVVELAKSIPPRALMAWDRRLLSRSQHLTLLISGFRGAYPPLDQGGLYSTLAQRSGSSLTFKVGLTQKYKPGKEYAKDAGRTFGLILADAEDELRVQAEKAALEDFEYEYDGSYSTEQAQVHQAISVEEDDDKESFDRFSLSSSLEALLDHSLLKLIQLRRKFGLGWAGAELLFSIMEKTQTTEDNVFNAQRRDLLAADAEESQLARTNELPHDPFLFLQKDSEVNITLTAFCYLIRRLSLCPRYCIVCHNKLDNEFEALKPYVCDSKLCTYQYYTLNRGPSLEYEIIHNPKTVDLLVSIAHSAATEQVLNDPLPIGLGLRVPAPDASKIQEPPRHYSFATATPQPGIEPPVSHSIPVNIGSDGMCDFDELSLPMMRVAIVALIDTLPAIDDMKKHLERKVKAGKAKPRLRDLDPTILPAAWSILRCVGSPDAEAKFKGAVITAQQRNANAIAYPSLYAFHGSALRNWHSIIRHGLWFKNIANGRAFGDGVYLAKEGNISMGTYAQPGRSTWRKSKICPTNCVALAEVVNLPNEFVSHNPYFVIKDTHWIICRYLLVKGAIDSSYETIVAPERSRNMTFPLVRLDPSHPVTLNSKHIEIPEPTHQIAALIQARQHEFCEEENDDEDTAVFENKAMSARPIESEDVGDEDMMDVDMDYYDDNDYSSLKVATTSTAKASKARKVVVDDWKHDSEWVKLTVGHLMPPPSEANPRATMAVQRELRATLKEQETAKSLKELGWYMPPDLIGDNLFQWIVEMHSFDEDLPIARDLKARNLNSVIFEIRFPPSYPNTPPFFRILSPRFLPFIQGGGGHITGGRRFHLHGPADSRRPKASKAFRGLQSASPDSLA